MPDPFPDRENQAEPPTNAQARAAEAAAIRRRWITLGEVLAVVAIVISALTLWNSWSERTDSNASKAADARQASTRATTLILVAGNSDTRVMSLKPADHDQSVQSQRIIFPTALGVSPVETTGEPRIETNWFERALKKARSDANLPDDSRGDERLPLAITTRFLVDGASHEDVALYDVGYTVSGRWFAGHSVKLRGLSLVSRIAGSDAQARLDARWRQLSGSKSARR